MIAVVGSGYAGAATAWWLARRGHGSDVVMLEAEPRAGEHASGRNAGLVMSLTGDPAMRALTVRGARLHREAGSLRPTGSIQLLGSADVAGELLRSAERLDLRAEAAATSDLARRIPLLGGAASPHALICHDDGKLDPKATLDRYIGEATEKGARLVTGARVTAVHERSGRVKGVETTAGRFAVDGVINAAGAWAGHLGKLTGLTDLGLRSFRRHLFLSAPERRVEDAWPFVWDLAHHLYFRTDNGRVLVSPCDEQLHEPGRPETSEEVGIELKERLARFLPALAPLRLEQPRACLRTFAPDRRYVIGPDPRLEGFFWVAGLGGTGATASAAIGELAADLLLGKEPSAGDAGLLSRLSPRRFVNTEGSAGGTAGP